MAPALPLTDLPVIGPLALNQLSSLQGVARIGPRILRPIETVIRRFVHECSRHTNEMEHATEELDNLERARLLLVVEEANDLGPHLRRSPRNTASIAVRLRSDTLGGTWEEDTETVTLSRYGTSVQCSHPAKPGECLQIIRSDTGQKVQALVVWQRSIGTINSRIGVEFMNCDNFWGLNWASVEEAQ
jgi:hypothetical protein